MEKLNIEQEFINWGKEQFIRDVYECGGIQYLDYIKWEDEENLTARVCWKLYEEFGWSSKDVSGPNGHYWLEYYADIYCKGYNEAFKKWKKGWD